jgi:hypothetical protein
VKYCRALDVGGLVIVPVLYEYRYRYCALYCCSIPGAIIHACYIIYYIMPSYVII